ncbi:MAG: carbon dioxide concentrating mechanism protein CcmL [Pirellulaceae bacterium]|nr:carbon dioxide concentrating mechanism protein CcmL [Pirellulaceae bacterium]
MKIHKVIGNVTLSRCHPCYQSARLLAAEPQEQTTLTGKPTPQPELAVVWDDLGAGLDSLIAVSDGAEAAQPFRPDLKAVDAYCSAILDNVHVDAVAVGQLKF